MLIFYEVTTCTQALTHSVLCFRHVSTPKTSLTQTKLACGFVSSQTYASVQHTLTCLSCCHWPNLMRKTALSHMRRAEAPKEPLWVRKWTRLHISCPRRDQFTVFESSPQHHQHQSNELLVIPLEFRNFTAVRSKASSPMFVIEDSSPWELSVLSSEDE